MRLPLAALGLALSLASAGGAMEPAERFPYSAFVSTDEASIRSGPGETFYPVLTMRLGDAVEVWRHDPGGWCAIRPPEGSFSWISADFVRQTGERTGVVVGSQVNVRVGTQFSDLRDAVQVRLDDGEALELIEQRALLTGDRETLWFKIHPPAGEFRWIHERQLVRHPDLLPKPKDIVQAGGAPTAPRDPFPSSVQPASFTEAAGGGNTDAALERGPVDVLAGLKALPADASPTEVLDELESVLSRMVTAEPTAWNFAELERRANALHEATDSAVERSRARMYLSKLARFQDIQKRYSAIAHLREQTADVDRALSRNPAPAAAAPPAGLSTAASLSNQVTPASAEQPLRTTTSTTMSTDTTSAPAARAASRAVRAGIDTTRYDAIGRLTQLIAGEKALTNYALTDENGEVRTFVTAAPGINLRQYLGLDVGINGIRSFLPEKRMDQLTAKRVDVLESRTRR